MHAPAEYIAAEGCPIAVRRLGDPAAHPIMLIHGGGGHAGWWLDAAPLLARTRYVIAVELSGHGDSGHRESYAPELWAREIALVIKTLGLGASDVVGHSMGGLVALFTAALHKEAVARLAIVDSVVVRKVPPQPRIREVQYSASLSEALLRFRFRPRGTTADEVTRKIIGTAGLQETPRGWRFKFDPAAVLRFPLDRIGDVVARIQCPTSYIFGEQSELCDRSTGERLAELLQRDIPIVEIPRAFHHVPVDEPAALVTALEELLPIA